RGSVPGSATPFAIVEMSLSPTPQSSKDLREAPTASCPQGRFLILTAACSPFNRERQDPYLVPWGPEETRLMDG
ncbi:mCG1040947, partial [Mus musculus]